MASARNCVDNGPPSGNKRTTVCIPLDIGHSGMIGASVMTGSRVGIISLVMIGLIGPGLPGGESGVRMGIEGTAHANRNTATNNIQLLFTGR